MGVIRHKIWKDLWANKARTIQVVLIIGMGAFAIGMIVSTRNLVVQGMEQGWIDSSPAMIALATSARVDDDTIRNLKRIEGVVNSEAYSVGEVEWRMGVEEDWQPANVTMRPDYLDQHYFVLELTSGSWPDGDVVAVGQGTDTVYGAAVGEKVTIKRDGRDRVFTVGGVISDPIGFPPSFGGNAQFFVTRDTFEELFDTRDYSHILATAARYDEREVTAIANRMRDKLEKQNVDTSGFMLPAGARVIDPSEHFFQDAIDGIFFLLGAMAVLTLLLGLFLVYNTINAIISQQVEQIGVMKAIGASGWQILTIYLLYVLAFGLLALLIAVPLGALGGWALNVFLMGTFNADPGPFKISSPAIWAQVIIALLAPLLVALVPIVSGARTTVREAMSTYGLSTKPSLLDRLISRLKKVSRLLLLTISNTFRHKGRVVLTQITLVLSGLVFMMVMSVGDSAAYTFNELLFSILNSNINLAFEDPERIKRLETLTMSHPNVRAAEMWGIGGATAHDQRVEGTDDDPSITIFGVQPQTELYGYQMRQGRWLAAEDSYAAVLNQELAADLGVTLGDWVTFDQGSIGESDWLVVGLIFDPLLTNTALVRRATLLREQNQVGRANSIWIQLKRGVAATEQAVAIEIRQLYEANGIDVSPGGILDGQDTSSEVVEGANTRMGAIIVLLSTMAVLIGVVGSISLSGALSLSVIERQREIGVMRAIGASSWDIARIFIGEGLILGWLSWLIAFPLSLPAGRLMTEALSAALGSELVYKYTPQGAVLWLGLITVLAALASWLPARRAARLSVREALSYQ
jgi:putative ABC transport system permease protein